MEILQIIFTSNDRDPIFKVTVTLQVDLLDDASTKETANFTPVFNAADDIDFVKILPRMFGLRKPER